jgi:YfiR/HmsC-like
MKTQLTSMLLALVCFVGVAQDEKPLHEIHSAMLFSFMKYIQWPTESEGGEFVLGILGEDNVFNTMKARYEGKPKGSKKYVVRKLSNAAEAANCDVVYIGKSHNRDFDNVKAAITGKNILTITDSANLGHKGSCINFKVIGSKLKFEINNASVSGANLKVSSQLTSMAIMI